MVLRAGERALLFISALSDELYEDPWRGHMVVEQIDGDLYAIFQHEELWLRDDVPDAIRASARQDPKRPYASAIRLEAMEAYLLDLIEKIDQGGCPTPSAEKQAIDMNEPFE
ncbi:hypothetical protein OOT46_03550 [Aquabacterium sp. A7-Y]|uniref:hypothetical protein n=1 Tax=Aquabacterium sp. A7-Y TaxID=1349605 RepID=UPI00223DB7D0|nr:hypothetical protein [Aquabacterium sp. A7-Y]MCW7536927.1 hypothetical protein [Aquabacterium sp. A7-Y]